jgi:ABC-type Fe3+ transport system permease subunit
VTLPLAFPGVVAGSDLHLLADLGDYIIPTLVGTPGYFIGMMVYQQQGTGEQHPAGGGVLVVPIVIMAILPVGGEAGWGRSMRCKPPLGLKLAAWAGLAFLNVPCCSSSSTPSTTEDRTYQFPPPG